MRAPNPDQANIILGELAVEIRKLELTANEMLETGRGLPTPIG